MARPPALRAIAEGDNPIRPAKIPKWKCHEKGRTVAGMLLLIATTWEVVRLKAADVVQCLDAEAIKQ